MSVAAVFKPGKKIAFTEPLYRYDYGQTLLFEGVELPETFIVHFSNTEKLGTATTAIGEHNEVRVPDEYLRHSWEHIFATIFLSDENSGQTILKAVIPVQNRPGLSDPIPTPVEESIIQRGINIMARAIETVEGAAESIEKAKEIVDNFESGNLFIDGKDAEYVCGGEDHG